MSHVFGSPGNVSDASCETADFPEHGVVRSHVHQCALRHSGYRPDVAKMRMFNEMVRRSDSIATESSLN